ncbi:MAG: T9SS type A sorting domain-containing protein, partial [Ignavibacteria bacterium]|nr:T9SS type A sorting domain-containing protein [Ignavibacteria bacterium]
MVQKLGKMIFTNKLDLIRALISIIMSISCLQSSSQSVTWQKVLNNNFGVLKRIIQTTDGGYVSVGTDRINNIDKMYLVKVNNLGNVLWTRIIGVGSTQGNWVEQTSDSGLIIGGSIDSAMFNNKVYLVKTDSQGNIVWDKTYSNSNLDQCYCVKQIFDGGYILACRTTPSNLNKVMFIRTDSSGNMIWKKIYGNNSVTFINEIQVFSNGFIGIGSTGLQNTADGYLIKLGYNGDTLWTRTIGGNKSDILYSIDTIGMEGYILGGTSNSFNSFNSRETFLVKTDTNGTEQWNRTYSGNEVDVCRTVKYILSIGYLVAGYSDSIPGGDVRAKVRIINQSGALLKETSFLPAAANCTLGVFNSAQVTVDGGFAFAGYNEVNTFLSMYIVKTDSLLFAEPIGLINISTEIPNSFLLYQNYPNPFNPKTNIKFQISESSDVKLIIYNTLGKEINSYNFGNIKPGVYMINWNAENLASGMYFYSVEANG